MYLKGNITVGREPRNLSKLRQQSCYITQEFSMLNYLTVRETLHIAACLKLSTNISNNKKLMVVSAKTTIHNPLSTIELISTFHVSFKSYGAHQQCLLRFLKLNLKDPYEFRLL